MMRLELRPLAPEDEPILWQMLVHAAGEPSLQSLREEPELACYAAGWGRKGDLGCVASDVSEALPAENWLPVGAAWVRLWLGAQKGFGYVDDSIPELTIAVLPEHRGMGIGTQLLNQLLEASRNIFPAISLSVRSDNHPAIRLYRRAGFVQAEESDKSNRVGGHSFTMIYWFAR